MSTVDNMIARLRGLDVERLLPLRPPYPPVVLQLEHDGLVLLRLKRRRRGGPLLESLKSRPLESVPASIFESDSIPSEELTARMKELFEVSGTRPGRVSLVVPDNLAKISLLGLPERPASRRQLDELVRSKMRRAVPFRLDEASISYQLLPGESRGVSVLVVIVRRSLTERIERAVDAVGARVGLIDISTPNLLNLCRDRVGASSRNGGDAALLNCAPNYFSLVITRGGRLIFFRCKSHSMDDALSSGPNGAFLREMASSFSYYREKLAGQGVERLILRSVVVPPDELAGRLGDFGCAEIEALDPVSHVELGEGVRLDAGTAQRVASALGAAVARGN